MSKLHLTQSGTGCWVSLGALQIAVYSVPYGSSGRRRVN